MSEPHDSTGVTNRERPAHVSTALFERRAGSGPLLVLVHGFGVRASISCLRGARARLRRRAPDLPGYGRSPKPAERR